MFEICWQSLNGQFAGLKILIDERSEFSIINETLDGMDPWRQILLLLVQDKPLSGSRGVSILNTVRYFSRACTRSRRIINSNDSRLHQREGDAPRIN
jgi:hypothetical protein